MIRNFTPDDIVFIEHIGQAIDVEYEFKINPYTRCFVYEQDNIIVGFIVFSIIYEKTEIIDIAVDKNYIRKTIGLQLLTSVFNECVLNNCEDITLEVRDTNIGAISLYKKYGFKELSVRKSYYRDGEDALVMIKLVVK